MANITCIFRMRLELVGTMLAKKLNVSRREIFPGAQFTFEGSTYPFLVESFSQHGGTDTFIVTLSPPNSVEFQAKCRAELMATKSWTSVPLSASADQKPPRT